MADIKLSVGLQTESFKTEISKDLAAMQAMLNGMEPLKVKVKFEPTKESLKELQSLLSSVADSIKAFNNAATTSGKRVLTSSAAKQEAAEMKALVALERDRAKRKEILDRMAEAQQNSVDKAIAAVNAEAAAREQAARREEKAEMDALIREERARAKRQEALDRASEKRQAAVDKAIAEAQREAQARERSEQQQQQAIERSAQAEEKAEMDALIREERARAKRQAALDKMYDKRQAEVDKAIADAQREAEAAEKAAEKEARAQEKKAQKAAQAAQKAEAAAQKEARAMQDVAIDAQTLTNQITSFINANKGLSDETVQRLQELQTRLQSVGSRADLTTIKKQFQEIKAEAKAAGQTVDTFGQQLKRAMLGMVGIYSTDMAIRKVFELYKKGIEIVHELDDSLIDLKKTTTMSSSELKDFYFDANEQAKQLGVTTKEIIQQAAEWSRLGFSSKHEASEMAALSSQFAIISPGMSVEDATTGLVSVMKAYGVEVDDVLDGIMSKINAVGNTAATNNAEIITGLRNSSSALAMVGGTLEDNIALFTAGQEIVQDASRVGNAIRTMVMRIRGYDEETGEISDDLKNITGDLIDLTKTANNPNGISVFTDETQSQYKQLGQYLKEISMIFDELEPKAQQDLLEKLFGKRTATVGASILNNMEAYDKALNTMSHSAGSADAEMSIVTESISYHLNQLHETWTGISQDLFQSDQIIAVTDALTGLSKGLGAVMKVLGPVGTFGAALGAIAIIPKLGSSNEFALDGFEPIAA